MPPTQIIIILTPCRTEVRPLGPLLKLAVWLPMQRRGSVGNTRHISFPARRNRIIRSTRSQHVHLPTRAVEACVSGVWCSTSYLLQKLHSSTAGKRGGCYGVCPATLAYVITNNILYFILFPFLLYFLFLLLYINI